MDTQKYSQITADERIKMLELARYDIPIAQIARLIGRSPTPVYGLFHDVLDEAEAKITEMGVSVNPAGRTPAQIATAIAELNTPAPAPVSETPPAKPAASLVGHLKRAASVMGAHIVTPRGTTTEDMTALVAHLRSRIEAILVVLDEAEAKITDRS